MKVTIALYLGLDISKKILRDNELRVIIDQFCCMSLCKQYSQTKMAVYLNLHLSRCRWNWYVPFLMSTHKLLPMYSLDVQT